MILSAVTSVAVGALLWLDRVFIFQFMVSRPIVLSPIMGFIMGDVSIGLIVGASLELLWLNAPPVGAYLPNDESFCAVVATPTAVCAAGYMSDTSAAGLALLASLPFALVGRSLDVRIRTLNQDLLPEKIEDPEHTVERAMGKALARSYAFALVTLGISAGLLWVAVSLIGPALPSTFKLSLSFMPSATVIIGLAGLLTKGRPKPSHAGLFVLGMTIVVFLSWMR
ncbi:MAG TPA: PTS sugar transporter subunit IIC [Deltaproteobacteria bacterium]|nr:PTS sugar transporter subunit IIC [Deltaproteobacteria bacterium]